MSQECKCIVCGQPLYDPEQLQQALEEINVFVNGFAWSIVKTPGFPDAQNNLKKLHEGARAALAKLGLTGESIPETESGLNGE